MGRDGNDLEWPRHAVMLGDRDILADGEAVIGEAVDRLIVLFADLIGESPLLAAAVDQQSLLVDVIGYEAPHVAEQPHRGPGPGVQMAVLVQRRNQLIAVARIAVGRVLGTRQFEPDFLELYCHSDISAFPLKKWMT